MSAPKQRTIHFPDGSTVKVHPEHEIAPGEMSTEKPTRWVHFKLAVYHLWKTLAP